MSVGKKKNIFTNSFHFELGIVVHDLKVECSKKIRTSQGSTRMAAIGSMNHSQNVSSDLSGYFFEICFNSWLFYFWHESSDSGRKLTQLFVPFGYESGFFYVLAHGQFVNRT